jgi:hypothetical protein
MTLVALRALLGMSSLIRLLIEMIFYLTIGTSVVCIGTSLIWQRRRFREALRQELLAAGICPAFCFECGYNLEGYEGKACPVCDAVLLRQAGAPSEE